MRLTFPEIVLTILGPLAHGGEILFVPTGGEGRTRHAWWLANDQGLRQPLHPNTVAALRNRQLIAAIPTNRATTVVASAFAITDRGRAALLRVRAMER